MTITVLLILAVLWAAVLVPPFVRNRLERRGDLGPLDYRLGGGSRSRLGSALARPPLLAAVSAGPYRPGVFTTRGPRSVGDGSMQARAPGELTPAQKRRRDVLLVLGGAAALTFLVAVFTGAPLLWVLQIVADLLLAVYLFLLVQMRHRVTLRPLPLQPMPFERPRQVRHSTHVGERDFAVRRTVAP